MRVLFVEVKLQPFFTNSKNNANFFYGRSQIRRKKAFFCQFSNHKNIFTVENVQRSSFKLFVKRSFLPMTDSRKMKSDLCATNDNSGKNFFDLFSTNSDLRNLPMNIYFRRFWDVCFQLQKRLRMKNRCKKMRIDD